jgi:ribosomal protein S18 acetylase RimI-like enzyme
MSTPTDGSSVSPERAPGPVAYRPGRVTDLDACIRTWRRAVDAYQGPLGQPPLPEETGPLRRHLVHMVGTDPDRFWVAETAGDGAGGDGAGTGGEGAGDVAGFALATERDGLWYLAMLFVLPEAQGRGIGAALLDRAQAARDVLPGGPAVPCPGAPLDSGIHTWGMATDTAQPISNAMYARRGMTPRVPAWRLSGEPYRWSALPALPRSLEAVPFDAIGANGHEGPRRLAEAVGAIDREVIGITHPADHEYLRRDGRTGFLVREREGRVLGYAYGSGVGRLGPVAALDPALLPSLLGVAIRGVPTFGAVAAWVPGTAEPALRGLLDAGLRLDRFPAILCWSRPDHPFARYLPINLAMV